MKNSYEIEYTDKMELIDEWEQLVDDDEATDIDAGFALGYYGGDLE